MKPASWVFFEYIWRPQKGRILSGLCQKHFSVYGWGFLSSAESFHKPNVCELSLLWLDKLLEMLSEWLLFSWNCWIELWFIQKELDCGSQVHSANFVELFYILDLPLSPGDAKVNTITKFLSLGILQLGKEVRQTLRKIIGLGDSCWGIGLNRVLMTGYWFHIRQPEKNKLELARQIML